MNSLEFGCVREGANRTIGFYIVDTFTMLPFISALEPLRIANRLAEAPLYQWRIISDTGQPVTSSSGMVQPADRAVDNDIALDLILVSGPFYPSRFDNSSLYNRLKQLAEQGTVIAGLETGCHILAEAGLLDGLRCTTHWENINEFQQRWPDHHVSSDLFEVDQQVLTCSGGAASMDMMLYIIEQHHGYELAASVADRMIHPHVRHAGEPQRMGVSARTGVTHPELLECIELIEANIEQPLTPAELADLVGISKRQLERLFRRYLNTTPARYYLTLRLETAKRMLESGSMKIIDVALACGFKSAGHFSSRYYSSYGVTPRHSRKLKT